MYFTASQYLKSFLKILVVTLKNEIFLTLYSVKFERSALLSESILSQWTNHDVIQSHMSKEHSTESKTEQWIFT